MTYDRLSADELQGDTQADYLIALEADLRVIHRGVTIFVEPRFPVVELARSLSLWIREAEKGDFEFRSMSFEEIGVVAFRREPQGWRFESAFQPGTSTPTVDWAEVDSCCRRLIARVEFDLTDLGLDPAEVLRP